MQAKIQKWGNGLAVRIPSIVARHANIDKNMTVEMSLNKGSIIITPVSAPQYTLEELLSGVSENNLHAEFSTGDPAGEEVW